MRIERLDAQGAEAALGALADILLDVVEGGASVSFMHPFTRAEAEAFWRKVIKGVAAGEVLLFVAYHEGQILGTVQLHPAGQPNQSHRADIAKMLVHRRAQRLGLAKALMTAAEQAAKAMGRWLITLDTLEHSSAEQLYRSLGYQVTGTIPDYARLPDGPLRATMIFWKKL